MRIIAVLFMVFCSFITNATSVAQTYNDFRDSNYMGGYNLAQRYSGQSDEFKNYLRNVCGVMSLLAVHNYYSYVNSGNIDAFTSSKSSVKDAVERMFEDKDNYSIGKSPIKYYQWASDLQALALKRWGWNTARIRSTEVYSTLNESYTQLINDLSIGRPLITLMKAGTSFEPLNDKGEGAGIDHFVTVIYANSSRVSYFDPWDGKIKWTSASNFKSSWVNTFISLATQP